MGVYNRKKAAEYADRWWNSYNPRFRTFEVDCTNYVSQCLWAGGAPMTGLGQKGKGWWYQGNGNKSDRWSYSWAVAHSLRWYLQTSRTGLRAIEVKSPEQLTIGDVICYDFDGDGKWQHNTIVTAIDPIGMPLVNAHTVNSIKRNWAYKDSYAWTEKTQYKYFHIVDQF
ncbi:amidase domain-containing protein [Tepidibacillus infernus]|uniref:Putative amidase domain-containing protein n=1 Tax=Tepidibacillus decaturensis TaxID=1413211 RepID=A0A135L1E0_9BACI|nr:MULTISPECIES: amidase domain-containing protein [Tepidibacillus]KXG42785.1 hypothetical protein U473_01100 [Tepidibacillus decaturensis]GBF12631.1 putative amidase domain protein [Tepidibacillus sp. HK-1]